MRWKYWALGVAALAVVLAVLFAYDLIPFLRPTGSPTPAVFDFDNGTTQGWTSDGILLSNNQKVNGSRHNATHNEAAQYPSAFPQGDPLTDKKGSLAIGVAPGGLPGTSWRADVVSPNLGPAFIGITGVELAIGDLLGKNPGDVQAFLYLRASVGGSLQDILEQGPGTGHMISKTSWTNLSATFMVPAGASVQNIVIRLRGEFGEDKAYEGYVLIDQVAKK